MTDILSSEHFLRVSSDIKPRLEGYVGRRFALQVSQDKDLRPNGIGSPFERRGRSRSRNPSRAPCRALNRLTRLC